MLPPAGLGILYISTVHLACKRLLLGHIGATSRDVSKHPPSPHGKDALRGAVNLAHRRHLDRLGHPVRPGRGGHGEERDGPKGGNQVGHVICVGRYVRSTVHVSAMTLV